LRGLVRRLSSMPVWPVPTLEMRYGVYERALTPFPSPTGVNTARLARKREQPFFYFFCRSRI
jgi:hypothetical protein